jgi:caffeoyl-CoA O-methyltransferase
MNNKIYQVLSKLQKQSQLEEAGKVNVPHDEKMLAITPDTGKFFNIFLKSANTKNMLEIGTSTGYSTLWFADALITNHKHDCSIITIEENSSKIKRAKNNFEKASVSNIITIKKGKAKNVLNDLSKKFSKNSQKFDFVFIDADKENMIKYFDQVLPLVKKGGIIAADNILFPEKFRPLTGKYSKHVQKQTNVQTVTVPIGNGEEISFKISD